MSQPSPWSIKGIGPDARRLAKKAAQQDGMTLGAWLSQKIAEAAEPGTTAAVPHAAENAAYRAPAPRPEAAAAVDNETSAEMMALMRELTELMRAERARPAPPVQTAAAPDPRIELITRSLGELSEARNETSRRLEALDATTRRIDEALVETVDAIEANRRQTATAVRAAALLAERIATLDPELADESEDEATRAGRLAPQTALDALAERLNQRCDATEAALQALSARLEQAGPHDAAVMVEPSDVPDDMDLDLIASGSQDPEIVESGIPSAPEYDHQADIEASEDAEPGAAADDPWSSAFAGAPAAEDEPVEEMRAEEEDIAEEHAEPEAPDEPSAPAYASSSSATSLDPWERAFGGGGAVPEPEEAEFLPRHSHEIEIKPLGVAALRDRLRADLEKESHSETSLGASLQKIRNLLPKSHSAPASAAETAAGLAKEIRALDEILKSERDGSGADEADADEVSAGEFDREFSDVFGDRTDDDAGYWSEEDWAEATAMERADDASDEPAPEMRADEQDLDHDLEQCLEQNLEENFADLVERSLRADEVAEAESAPPRHAMPSWLTRRPDDDEGRGERRPLQLDSSREIEPEVTDSGRPGEDSAAGHSETGGRDVDRLERSRQGDEGFAGGRFETPWVPTERHRRPIRADRYLVEGDVYGGASTHRSGTLPLALFSATIGVAIMLAYGATL